MSKADIKIVGSISNEEELDEIQSIAKIFIYEQRIKCFNRALKEKNLISKNYLNRYKKTDNCRKIICTHLPYIKVRGLV